jgi:hypothetical protein
MKQRIALVAVSALTAGLFSVVPVQLANAGTADVTASTFWLATSNSATVTPTITAAGGDTALDKSKGFVALTSTSGADTGQVTQVAGAGLNAGTTGTAVALQTASLVFNAAGGATTDVVSIVATNGTVNSANTATFATTNIVFVTATKVVTLTTAAAHGLRVGDLISANTANPAGDASNVLVASVPTTTTFTYVNPAGGDNNVTTVADVGVLTVVPTYNGSSSAVIRTPGINPVLATVATPNAGATSMTVRAYKGTALTTADPTNGTLLGTWSITLAAAAATSTFSPALSLVALGVSTAAQITSSVDASTGSIGAGNPYYIQVIGKNAYSEALAAGTYVATATNGATLNWGDSANGATIVAGTLSVATKTPDGTDQLRIDPASSLTTTSTTVTITHDGLPVATKTMTFYGEAKKIVIEKVVPGTAGTAIAGNAATAYAIYSYRDSADGKVPGAHANFVPTVANSTVPSGASNRQPSRSTGAAAATTNLAAAQVTLIGLLQDGVFAFSCGSTPGKAKGTITHTNAITGTVLTAEAEVGCFGPISTYTVSTDKASYAVGEVATITVDGKDAVGNPVSDAQLLGALTISVGGGTLTVAVGAADVFTAGKATYKAQMTTAGTFNTVVSIVAGVTTSATTSYKISDGNVSNAEVLKSIVALIASINKQIAALQKLILKR